MKLFSNGRLFILLAAVLLSSCATSPKLKQEAPAAKGPVAIPEYVLGFGDVIEVKFFNNERFNETVTVRPDGRMTLERMGDLLVSGMTPAQLDSTITERYSVFVKNPEVTVFVRQFGGQQFYVLGEVNTPGGYPLQRSMNVLQALAAAGGFKNTARLGNVMLLRRNELGGVEARKLDLTKAVAKGYPSAGGDQLNLQPLDIVYVPRTFIASTAAFLSQVYEGLLPPVDAYLSAWYLSTGRR